MLVYVLIADDTNGYDGPDVVGIYHTPADVETARLDWLEAMRASLCEECKRAGIPYYDAFSFTIIAKTFDCGHGNRGQD